jgi:hypothetical protein
MNKQNFIRTTIFVVFNMFIIGATMFAVYFGFDAKSANNNNGHTIENAMIVAALKNEIILEIDKYIYDIAPSSGVRGEVLFTLCDKYGVDVRFAMAQAQVESHYATKGTSKRTKSIFNVGAYDGHSAKRQIRNGFGFKDPNDSIEPYLRLITTEYLIGDKTIHDLMNTYTNHLGMRYATNPRYEKMLRCVYNRINTQTEIGFLLNQYNKYKHLDRI